MGATRPNEKSTVITYFLWFFFGLFGGHHFYLERDIHAFLTWSTIGGGFGVGWLRDLFCLKRYIGEANNDENYLKQHISRMKSNGKVCLIH